MKRSFKTTFFIFAAFSLAFISCDKNEKLEQASLTETEKSVRILGENVEVKNNTLSFSDENSLNHLVAKMNQQKISQTRMASEGYSFGNGELTIEGFTSLYDTYTQAMKEAESYYDREGGYEQFKEKYSTLYFPEYKDDYSVYLPVSDKSLAKLLNSNGEVTIGGELVDMKNINSYDQLKELGLSIPDIDKESGINNSVSTRSITVRQVQENEVVYSGDKTRKLWIDIQPQPSPNVNPPAITRFDVCFRKKGFLGAWYNYSSVTDFSLSCKGTYGLYTMQSGMKGASSHDYVFPVRWSISDQALVYGSIIVGYSGIEYSVQLAFNNKNLGLVYVN